jgi:hypothetical protein
MIETYCNDNIVNIFTHCSTVTEVYTYGQLVWPTRPSVYYVSWLPTNISGSFTMEGRSYSLQNYNGYFSGFAGVITPNAFDYTSGMSYMETNAYSINSYAFSACRSLAWVSMSKCTYLDSGVFSGCSALSSVYAPRLRSTSFGAFWNCSALSQISLPLLTHLGQNTFRSCYNLSSVSLPMCRSISADAFAGCRSLSQISLPLCNYLGAGAFRGCHSLYSVSLPVCSYVYGSAFAYCSALSQIELPSCKSIGDMTFYNCSSLYSVSLPVCEYVGGRAFYNCSALSQIELPACKSIGGYSTFVGTHLEKISLPVCESIGAFGFAGCSYLSSVELGSCTWLGDGVFSGCSSLTTLILSGSSMCDAYGNYVFSGTPFRSCSGSILVPVKLLGMYKRAPVWSDLSCVIYPLSSTPGSYYINWTPSYLSQGSFKLEGYTQYFADYSGSFPWFEGVIDAYYDSSASVYEGAFAYTEISTIETNAYKLESKAFNTCRSLTAASFPNCSYIGDGAFMYCSRLTTLDLPICEYIGSGVFQYCGSSLQVILGNSSVCQLNGILASSFSGTIYVPSSLVDVYQSAVNWSMYSSRIFPIES